MQQIVFKLTVYVNNSTKRLVDWRVHAAVLSETAAGSWGTETY